MVVFLTRRPRNVVNNLNKIYSGLQHFGLWQGGMSVVPVSRHTIQHDIVEFYYVGRIT